MKNTLEIVDTTKEGDLNRLLENRDPSRVRGALHRRRKGPTDLALLLSPGADELLEEIAHEARQITLERFGRTVQLYAPLYISNYCVGGCPYCGFRANQKVTRRALKIEEILSEGALLNRSGMRHILLVSGEDPKRIDMDFLVQAITQLQELAPSISVEVPPLDEKEYCTLAEAGADGVTLYQETYDPGVYGELHRTGPKADYQFRLDALDRAGAAGMPKLTLGALLGLSPWRLEGLRIGLHALYLQKKHWRSQIAVGLPRLHHVPNDFKIPYPLNDRSFVHLIVAMRVFLEDAGLVLSTRETPELREQLVLLGITQMSAGSKTEPGGYSSPGSSGDQFQVADHRTPDEVANMLIRLGYDPVWKNWDRVFRGLHD
ncbi:MAG: 2-iminoacetate synthase ThiH [Proteobacteria bacterium]|nr:2-iminoacetate synthase ThiH [Pseudomonadota bacterium]